MRRTLGTFLLVAFCCCCYLAVVVLYKSCGSVGNSLDVTVDCQGCFFVPYKFSLLPYRDTCYVPGGVFPGPYMVALVMTMPSASHTRHILRNTLLAATRNNTDLYVRYVFVMGLPSDLEIQQKIETEAQQFGDIVQQDFLDMHSSLTLKTRAGLRWATEYCQYANYVIKMDDNILVNFTKIVQLTETVPDIENRLVGDCVEHSQPSQHDAASLGLSKRYVSQKVIPLPYYPSYCRGGLYLLSMKVAEALLQVAPHTPFLPLADVYLGACLYKTGYSTMTIPAIRSGVRFQGLAGTLECHTLHAVTTLPNVRPEEFSQLWQKCYHA